MIIERQQILNDLMPQLQMLANMQKEGKLALPQIACTKLSKCISEGRRLQKQFDKFRDDACEGRVRKDDKGNYEKTLIKDNPNQNPHWDWVYKNEKDRDEFHDAINEWAREEYDWHPHKITQDDLKGVHNIPIDILATMEEFEITTDSGILIASQPPAKMGIIN